MALRARQQIVMDSRLFLCKVVVHWLIRALSVVDKIKIAGSGPIKGKREFCILFMTLSIIEYQVIVDFHNFQNLAALKYPKLFCRC